MAELQLDWSTAEVSGGKLTVSLDDKPSDEWAASFERTARLLDHGTWPDLKIKKDRVSVKGVEEGSEEKLRFFLDSVVQEANGEQPEEEDESEDSEDEDEGSADEEGSEEQEDEKDPDQEMTDRFRSFASGEEPRDSES